MKFPFFGRKAPLEEKVSEGYSLHFLNNTAVWSRRNYDAFVAEGFSQNVIVYQAIGMLATAVSSLTWQAVRAGEVVSGHPLLDLLSRPNPNQSSVEFWRQLITYLYLNGNSYMERVQNGRRTLELWNLRPDRMAIIPSTTGLPAGYQYENAGQKKFFPSDPVSGRSDVYHIRLTHPQDDWLGFSPVNAGAFAIDQHNESMKWMQALLQNSARPSGALVLKEDRTLSDAQFRRLKDEIEKKYSGSGNAGRPLLLEGGMDWKALGMTPEDMSFILVKDSAARDISLAFGVPPLLLGIPGDNTYSNYREARLGFYEDTVIPLARLIIAGFNDWMFDEAKGVKIQPNVDEIEAVADKRRALWEMVDSADELTVNEARKLKGFPPLADKERGEMLLADLRSSTRGHAADTTLPKQERNSDGTPAQIN